MGIHHITAIVGHPQENVDFYAGVLGLRLVKKTVNFDDPETYHLYFGNEGGKPGTIITFFPWPNAYKGKNGGGQVGITSYVVPVGALSFWEKRLEKFHSQKQSVSVNSIYLLMTPMAFIWNWLKESLVKLIHGVSVKLHQKLLLKVSVEQFYTQHVQPKQQKH